ncbi:hypothetical protein A2W24_04330 [Microgenomates group bacterium RBG_16_45_19]|nr:MAG: hypothetical protein A2W24_04330 [Microgenomates group bacterium RBG_16_45_19]
MLWTAPFLWMGVIFVWSSFSSLPSPDEPWLNWLVKKSAHVVEYYVLFRLWFRACLTKTKNWPVAAGVAGGVSLIYALTDEWHQNWVPMRQSRLADLLIDSLGICLGLWQVRQQQRKSIYQS